MGRQATPNWAIEAIITDELRSRSKLSRKVWAVTTKHKPPQAKDHAHYWDFLYDEIWVCRECNELRWIPNYTEAQKFAEAVGKHSFETVYKRMIKGRDQECIIELMEDSIGQRKSIRRATRK